MTEFIVYFSRSGENYVNGTIKNLKVGNTEVAAQIIHSFTGAKIFKLELLHPYSENYNECIEEAKEQKRHNARPELKSYPYNLDGSELIYLGYPNYWGTMPMAMFTLLEKCDFSGKIIKPFCTHEGSGMGNSEQDLQKMCPNAVISRGLALHGTSVEKSEAVIKKWLES